MLLDARRKRDTNEEIRSGEIIKQEGRQLSCAAVSGWVVPVAPCSALVQTRRPTIAIKDRDRGMSWQGQLGLGSLQRLQPRTALRAGGTEDGCGLPTNRRSSCRWLGPGRVQTHPDTPARPLLRFPGRAWIGPKRPKSARGARS